MILMPLLVLSPTKRIKYITLAGKNTFKGIKQYERHMKTLFLTTFFILMITIVFGQQDTISPKRSTQLQSTNTTWKGSCCDHLGKPLNPGEALGQSYIVKKFKTQTPIELNLKSIKVGSKTISLDFHYKDKIEGDTKIININDSVGCKITLAKTVENGDKKYLYKLQIFKKDTMSNCWRPLTNSMSFFDVYAQTMSLNLFGIGYPESNDYFQIVEGWMKFD